MTEETQVQEGQEQVVEYTPIQLKALEQGWKPKDQYEGEEDGFIDAAEFVRRGELFEKIDHQGKELKAVRRALEEFRNNQSKVREQEYERALKSLQAARRQAFTDGETDRAFEIEDQIESVKAEKSKVVQEASKPVVQEINPEFTAWTNENGWYGKDRVMRAAADAIGFEYANQGMAPKEVLKKVAEDIRKEFPHKFTNPKAARTSSVESPSRGGGTREAANDLDDMERQVYKKIIDSGIKMTVDEYKKQSRGA